MPELAWEIWVYEEKMHELKRRIDACVSFGNPAGGSTFVEPADAHVLGYAQATFGEPAG